MTRTKHCALCSHFSAKRICAENLVRGCFCKQLLRWELGPGRTGSPISERELYRVPSPPARTAGEEEAPEEKTRALRIEILESQVKDLQARLGPLEKDLLRRQGRRKERARRLESQDRERKSLSKETARSSGKQRPEETLDDSKGKKDLRDRSEKSKRDTFVLERYIGPYAYEDPKAVALSSCEAE